MFKWLLAPLLGGMIGYITNDLAIRMLFRPRRAIYIGRFQLPFTPGLIPRQQGRIAASIGAVVSRELLNRETLTRTFLSEEVRSAIRGRLDEFTDNLAQEPCTLREKLSAWLGEESVTHYEESLRVKGTAYLSEKLSEADAGAMVVRTVRDSLRERRGFGLLLGLVDDSFFVPIGAGINQLVQQNAPRFIEDELGRIQEEWLDCPVKELYARYGEKSEIAKQRLLEIYGNVVETKLGDALTVVNVAQMVTDKINAFSPEELEAMILDVMKHELRAIVWLGALLGALMGFLNLLIRF